MIEEQCLSSLVVSILPLVGVIVGALLSWYFQQHSWDRQRQWEMKRDVVFEAVRALGALDNALSDLYVGHDLSIPENEESRSRVPQISDETMTRWNTKVASLDGAKFLASMVVGKELRSALDKCAIEMQQIVIGIKKGTAKHNKASLKVLWPKIEAVYAAARKELNIKNTNHVVGVS